MKDRPLQHRVEYAVFLGLSTLIRALPHEVARSCGRGLGRLAMRALSSRRRVAMENLHRALPELDEETRIRYTRGCFENLGLALCDVLSAARYDRVELCRRMSVEGLEHLVEAEEKGRGVLVMSAHLGCWEAAALAVSLYQGSMAVVGRPLDNPWLDRRLTALRARFGNSVIDKRKAAREILRELRSGGKVGILIDQLPQPRDAIQVPFFGLPSQTSGVLAKLSLRGNTPVVPIFGYAEEGGGYRVVFRPAIEPSVVSSTGEQAEIDLTRRYLEVVEAEIRRSPALWLWLHRRWKR